MFLYPPLDWNLLKGKNHTSFNFIAEVPRTQMFELWNILVLKATGDMLKLANILFHPLIKIDLCQSPWVCFKIPHNWQVLIKRQTHHQERERNCHKLIESESVKVTQSCPTLCNPMDWSGQPFPSPGDLPNPGVEPRSPSLQVGSLPTEPQGKPTPWLGTEIWRNWYHELHSKNKKNLHLGFQQILLNKTGCVMYLILCVLYTHCMTLSKLKEWNIFSFS